MAAATSHLSPDPHFTEWDSLPKVPFILTYLLSHSLVFPAQASSGITLWNEKLIISWGLIVLFLLPTPPFLKILLKE